MHDPAFVKAAFGDVLAIDALLEIEPGRTLTFEYIGARDDLDEARNLPRARGSMTTSADAAIRYRTPDHRIEIALIEWKFTEDYRGQELSVPRGRPRPDRYRTLWEDPSCPLRHDVVPYDDLFVEPFYQLLRQQLLAWSMEREHELAADTVRGSHLSRSQHRGPRRGRSVRAISQWVPMHSRSGRRRKDPDRFICLDSSRFTQAGLRSFDYLDRYTIPSLPA